MSEQNILATIDGVNITDADLDAYRESAEGAAGVCGISPVQRARTEAASGIPSVCKDGRRRKNG